MAIEYLKKATKKPTTGEDQTRDTVSGILKDIEEVGEKKAIEYSLMPYSICLLYTSPSPRDRQKSRMPSSA